MAYLAGVVLFALGIFVSVCLHEAGHMLTAKKFGMKVTRYFAGFGPTLFSFRRGETEYGLKAIPLGGFVKIVGMTPQDDDVDPADEPRAMWRFPVWKRTVVMSAGSLTHFALAFVTLWVIVSFMGLPDYDRIDREPAKVASVAECVVTEFELDPKTKAPRGCTDADPASPAEKAGLRPGDVIIAVDGRRLATYGEMRDAIRASGGKRVDLTYARDGRETTVAVDIPAVERIRSDTQKQTWDEVTDADLERSGMLGIAAAVPNTKAGAIGGVAKTGSMVGTMFVATFESMKQIPQKIPALWRAVTGEERDPNTPISVVGASRIGGELAEIGDWTRFLYLFAALNLFFGVFNLLPLLPLDGGHIAISWFERVRSWLYARLRRPDPGRVDYFKLMPLTYAVILVGGVFVLLTVTADVINPIRILK
jgi:membrane-associated protease RseP (regulator of RpoE activity)